MSEKSSVPWKRVWLFIGILFVISYGLVGGFILMGGRFDDPAWPLFAQVSALSPAIVAFILTRLVWNESIFLKLNIKPVFNKWLFVAWLLAPALAAMALFFGFLMPDTHLDPTLQPAVDAGIISAEQLHTLQQMADNLGVSPVILLIPAGMLLSMTISLVAGCGEEFGWRGLVHSLLRPLGFWKNVGLTGILWLLWHLPLLFLGYGFPDHPVQGALLMCIHIMISAFTLAYLRERSSTFAAGLFHGANEAFILLAVAPVAGGTPITVGVSSLSWLAASAIIAGGLLAYDRLISKNPITLT